VFLTRNAVWQCEVRVFSRLSGEYDTSKKEHFSCTYISYYKRLIFYWTILGDEAWTAINYCWAVTPRSADLVFYALAEQYFNCTNICTCGLNVSISSRGWLVISVLAICSVRNLAWECWGRFSFCIDTSSCCTCWCLITMLASYIVKVKDIHQMSTHV
jgi:hypothetical protein